MGVEQYQSMKYYRQSKDYTCGPAVARMILNHHEIRLSESYLTKLLDTTKNSGTRILRLVMILRNFGLTCKVYKNSTIGQIKQKLAGNHVIVNYFLDDWKESHYSIVKKVTKSKIYLIDPRYGSKHHVDIENFNDHWHNSSKTLKKTMICVKK